jgi:hypothetical protein
LVCCDRCGATADKHARYCRLCGNKITPPPLLWRIRHRQKTLAPKPIEEAEESPIEDFSTDDEMELETRRLTAKTTEIESATDRTTSPTLPIAPAVEAGQPLTVTEQTHKEGTELQPQPSPQEEELLVEMKQLEEVNLHPAARIRRRVPSTIAGYSMFMVGILALASSAYFSSTILAFIGLGLTFWGALLLFIRPQKYVRSDLMDSTALSSLRTIDRVITSLGYLEKGIYIPGANPEKAVVFVPAEPFSRIPSAQEIGDQTFIRKPKGIAMVPPGLALANLIGGKLGVEFRKCSLETLRERLPKLLIEDLEIVQDLDMRLDGDQVRFKFVESIYSDFCQQLSSSTRVCSGLGCPICSAMACVLAISTNKPVLFEKDEYSSDRKTIESSYRILEA